LAALDTRTGKTVWRRKVASRSNGRPGACSHEWRPDISNERLTFVTPQGGPAVLDIGSGRVTWTAEPGARWLGMNGQLVFAQSADQRLLTAYRVTSGDPVWKIEVPKDASGAPKTIEHLVIGDNGIAYTTLYVRRVTKEELMWVRDLHSGKVRGFAEGVRPLAFDQDRLAAASGSDMTLFPEATGGNR
jgi:outer membrane protein assembly factor BamB